jgi:hypothetical protein
MCKKRFRTLAGCNKKICLLIVLLSASLFTFSQPVFFIHGRVMAEDDSSPIPKVSVTIKGARKGAVTDENGHFTLSVVKGTVLIFNHISYIEKAITIGGDDSIEVRMTSLNKKLEDVVVIGYGTQKK